MPLSERLNGPLGNGRGTPAGEHAHPATHGTQGLIQLCVIVEKDEVGYGLTVSGDKPVHVQSVKENGASAKAGVRTGDRIYKVNGASVANYDHTEVVNLIKAGSHVALTLLRKPEREHHRLSKTPTSPGALSVGSSKSASGSDRITHPIPADAKRRKSTHSSQAHQEQQVVKEKIDTVRRMYEEAAVTEKKLQQEYTKNKNPKTEARLQDARKTTGAIRKQLESLTGQPAELKNTAGRNSVCLGDVQSSSGDPLQSTAVSLPTSVDSPDSSVIRSPGQSTIGEITGTTSPTSDTDEEASLRRSTSSIEHRNSIGFNRVVSQNPAADIFSMDDDDFSPESQTIVRDHGPFVDFELLRNRHAHCSVFLSFLISNADPAPMLFTLASELYMSGSVKDMRRWAYEIHSTFIVKDAPLAIKLEDSIIETIENSLKANSEREDLWKQIFRSARISASEDISTGLADFRQKRELGLGNFFGDADLRDNLDKSTELRIIEKTLKPHFEKFAADETSRSQALSISLATVMKEWGVHKGGIDRQVSFAMKDFNRSSIKSVLGSRFKNSKKEAKSHQFNPHVYQTTTFCDHCNSLIWGIGFQGYICSNCEMNIHKECISQVDSCKKIKKKKDKRISIIPKQMTKSTSTGSASSLTAHSGVTSSQMHKRSRSFGSASMLSEDVKEATSATNDEELPAPSVAALKERFESSQANTNGEQTKSSVVRSESLNKKTESAKAKDSRRAKSDVDKDGGEKILTAIDQSRSSSSASSLSNKSDSSSNERVNDLAMKPAPIDEEGDSDLEVEESMPLLENVIRKDLLRKMKPKEKKLQEVINELLYTEKSHVRNLKLLDKLFHQPMSRSECCSRELVELVFPDIQSLIAIHVQLNNEMNMKMKEDPLVSVKDVATILLSRFDNEAGEKMKEVCALFCRNHSYALNVLKERRKRDAKVQELLTTGETNPMCRRLQFKDLMISEVHRLTKYPLLIDSMSNHNTSAPEQKLLSRASRCSRDILAHVNHAVKDCENHHKLVALQKRLDTKPIQNSANPLVADYKNLNLQDYKLVYEGALTWRLSTNRTKQQIDLHVVLLEEKLVLLQVQDDGKLVLKCQSQIATQSKDDSKFGHSPIITLNSMLVRQVATDKRAIYIINTSQLGPQIYDLVANSVEEKKRWFKYISEAADSQKKSHTIRRAPVNKSNLTLAEVSTDETAQEKFTDGTNQPNSNITTNNNISVEQWNSSPPPSYDQLTDVDAQSTRPRSSEKLFSADESFAESSGLAESLERENTSEVSASETSPSPDDDGERDPKSLVLASISDTVLLKQFLSSSAANVASLNAASPTPATKLDFSPAAAAPEQLSVLNNLSRKLSSLLDVMEERENERAQLQHQLQTAEQLLRDAPKDIVDSRPNSFVSNSSSSASVGDAADSQTNAIVSSIPVIPAVIQAPQPIHSDLAMKPPVDGSISDGSAESDSDDEGTVYADTKEEFSDEVKPPQRPDSCMSDLSSTNTHTDSTVISTDNLSDDTIEPNSSSETLLTDDNSAAATNTSITNILPQVTVNIEGASSTEDSDSDIEKTNIDDVVMATSAVTADTPNDIMNSSATDKTCTDNDVISNSEITTAASLVEQAMKAAMDIMKGESQESNAEPTDSASLEPVPVLDCENIVVDFESDSENSQNTGEGSGAASPVEKVQTGNEIDDSDEADALSASSLD